MYSPTIPSITRFKLPTNETTSIIDSQPGCRSKKIAEKIAYAKRTRVVSNPPSPK
jgi:hypothetical protein